MWKTTVTAALAALILAGCSGGSDPAASKTSGGASAPTGTPGAKSGTFKVALLTPGPVSDAGWSAMAYSGLTAIKSKLGAEVSNKESKDAQIAEDMRSYAQQGYDLVIGHGFEYNEPAVKTAKDFPKTVFISSSGSGSADNAGAFRFRLEEAFYVCGVMAANMTKTHVVAMIGGPDVPSIRSTFKAFRAGVLATDPQIQVKEEFTGENNDVAKAKQATLAAIGEGADFVIHQANAGAQGVFDACKEKKVYAFGANLDQNDNPSGAVIASAVIDAEPAFLALAKQVKEGKYKGGVVSMGMSENAVEFKLNPKLRDKLPAGLAGKLDDLQLAIMQGTTKVPMDNF